MMARKSRKQGRAGSKVEDVPVVPEAKVQSNKRDQEERVILT